MDWDTTVWDTTVWATEHTDTDTLTLIMDMPTTATVWDTEATEATTMDKFSASEVQSRSSKRT